MDLAGQTIKHFNIIRLIGKGGMGKVYLAQDTILNRKVAIKFLPEEIQDDNKTRQRFLREARSAASLDHPFICKIFETGESNGKAYIVMEYVEGKNLSERMREEPMTLRECLRVGLEISEALEKAQENRIVHRDLKPANIMITRQGHVKVMDFGLAKKESPSDEKDLINTLTQDSISQDGTVAGTPSYMAPEQARGHKTDGRSDLFSLGIILYELIVKKHPFKKATQIETMSAILKDAVPSLNIKPKRLIPALSPIFRKTLAKDPSDRYQSAADLTNDIHKAQRVMVIGSRLFHRGWPAIAALFTIIALITTFTWWVARKSRMDSTEIVPDPVSVLIADFQNNTNDPIFDGTLEEAMRLGLEGASFISTYKRSEALKIAQSLGSSSEGRLDVRIAKLVCIKEGINVVIGGVIEPIDKGYTFQVSVLDPVSSEIITSPLKKIRDKTEVLSAAGWLANKVISDLGGTPSDSIRALSGETFTTSSLEAMSAYVRAQELNRQGKEEALIMYRRAIEEDEDFGRAYFGLAFMYYNRGEYQEAEKYFGKALPLIDRMSEREKYRSRGLYYLVKRNYEKAIEELSLLIEQFPADSAAKTNLAYAYIMTRNFQKAIELGQQALELYPNVIITLYNLSWSAIALGDYDTAEQNARKVLELKPEYHEAYLCLALSQIGRELTVDADKTYTELKTIISSGASSLAAMGLADLALYEGRLMDAKELLEKGIIADLNGGRNEQAAYKQVVLAQTLLLLGQKTQALDLTNRSVKANQEMGLLFTAALNYIQSDREEEALALAEKLEKQLQPEPQAYAKLIAGEAKMANGDISEAFKLFKEAQDHLDTWLGRFALGRANLERAQFTEAHSELEMCEKRMGEATSVFFDDVPTSRYLPLIYYYLGRAQEGMKSPSVKESYLKFLDMKEKGDEGDLMVLDARRRLNNL